MTRLLLINKITYSHILLLYISFYKQVNDYFFLLTSISVPLKSGPVKY